MSKILFLAQFAPTDGKHIEPQTPEEKFYAETYHLKIYEILEKNSYNFYATSDVSYLINHHDEFDLVWSVYNRMGFRNSEVFVQSLCEYFGLKYIGAAPNVRALAEDKSMSKQLAEHLDLKTANWVVASKQYPLSNYSPFNGPYFVKPRFGSASIGIDESCLCEDWTATQKKANQYFSENIDVIVEEYIDGIHYGVPIMNTIEGTPIIATPHSQLSDKRGNIITYAQKRYTELGMSRCMCRDENLNKMLTHHAGKYFMNMQPCDYARIDFIVEKSTGIPYFLEVNVLMNLGIKGGFVASFLDNHFESYVEIIRFILNLGLHRVGK
ncbi:hypothetical protein [Candidatus Bathycorpusculum sp.]|uniref:hypothetical protein n=1 Tax=Candidatus Bathycorpusculum sp. TaxID=2994959 RepID=UPI00283420F9|nr:hypothetical protein [Candidatus Termitimicrobium sp.]